MTTTSSLRSIFPALGIGVTFSLRVSVVLIGDSLMVEWRQASHSPLLFRRFRERALARRDFIFGRSLDQCEQRLPFFDDIGGKLHPLAAADGLRRVNRSGRDEEH